jgi:voltage-dependent potassium channel beta subunit
MDYRKLGRSGLKVSEISLGSWLTFGQSVDDTATEACMTAAYDAGINFFDGAEGYGRGAAESAMGRVLKKTGWARDTLILSGKVLFVGDKPTQRGLSKKHLIEACDAALGRFGVDYLDLFFCHRPDPDTPLDEMCRTMHELILRGKILYWGTSEFSAADLLEIHTVCERYNLTPPTMEQCNYSMLVRDRVDRELVPLFQKYRLGTTIYSPLALGILTGKYLDGVPADSRIGKTDADWLKNQISEDKLKKVRALKAIAEDLQTSLAQMALAWTLNNPNTSTAIIGATKPEQVVENCKAIEAKAKLTPEVLDQIELILDNKPKD